MLDRTFFILLALVVAAANTSEYDGALLPRPEAGRTAFARNRVTRTLTKKATVLDLSDLTISRLVVFDVPTGDSNKAVAVPTGGLSVVNLTGPTHDMVVKRLTKVLGKNSHGIEASFDDTEAGSFFQLGASMTAANDVDDKSTPSLDSHSVPSVAV